MIKKNLKKKEVSIGLIAARRGSKGIKNKNLLKIKKISIVNHAIKLGLKIDKLNYLVLSSDSSKILNQTKPNEKIFKINRHPSLARDLTPMLPVMEDTINFVEKKIKKKVSYLVVLDPTSPFRLKKDIIKAIKIFKKKKLDLLVSVHEAEHNPYFSILEKYENYYSLSKGNKLNIGSRQKAKKTFNVNTVVWIYSRKAIIKIKKRIPFKTDILIVPENRAFELNTKEDLKKIKKRLKINR